MKTYGRKHWFDVNYFDSIDTPEKAYWLGFIGADGTITKNSTLTISLATKDKEHLYKFKKALKADQPIHHYEYPERRLDFVRINIVSLAFIDSLAKVGISPRKTFTLTFPKWLNKGLVAHYIRGYFDGDGTVGKYARPSARFVGNEGFLADVKRCLPKGFASFLNPHRRIFSLTIDSYRGCRILYDWMYKDAQVFLERKKNIFEQIIKPPNCQRCGRAFYPIRHWNAAFCSKHCRQQNDRNSFHWQTGRRCPICEQTYIPNRVHQTACSRECKRRMNYLKYHC